MVKKFLHFDNPDFISKIKDFDLISLVETWLPFGSQKITIDGYYSFSKHCKKYAQSARRTSSGITILVKSSKQIRIAMKLIVNHYNRWEISRNDTLDRPITPQEISTQ